MEKKIYTINADGQKMGRIATKAVSLLIGKNRADYVRNKVFNVQVIIENASKIDIFEGKLKTEYKRKREIIRDVILKASLEGSCRESHSEVSSGKALRMTECVI